MKLPSLDWALQVFQATPGFSGTSRFKVESADKPFTVYLNGSYTVEELKALLVVIEAGELKDGK